MSIFIKNGAISISENCFENCSTLNRISLPSSIKNIGEKAFYNCENITVISIPSSCNMDSIGDNAFAYCKKITSISLPTTQLGEYVLENCSSLSVLSFMGNLSLAELFGNTEFENSYLISINETDYYLPFSLKTIYLLNGATEIVENGFSFSQISNINLPKSLISIKNNAFSNSNLSNIIIASDNIIEFIGEEAFAYCNYLESVVIYDNIKTVGNRAFYDCDILQNVDIRNNSCDFGTDVFALTPWFDNQNGLIYEGTSLFGLNGVMEEEYNLIIQDGTENISDYAFKDCSNLKTIFVPNTIINIGKGAFENCTNLETVTFEESSNLKSFEENIFNNCISLTGIIVPNAVEYIGENAFNGCTSLVKSTFNIYSKVVTIGENAFADSGITRIYFSPSIKYINAYAFSNCINLTEIIFPNGNSIEYIGNGAFSNCQNAVFNINNLDNLFELGNDAFYNCLLLESCEAINLEVYGQNVFKNCYNLKSITMLPQTNIFSLFGQATNGNENYIAVEIFELVFSLPVSLKTIKYNDTNNAIAEFSCYDCTNIETIFLQGIKQVGMNAFEGCTSLEKVIGIESVEIIGKNAFKNCNSLIATSINGNSFQLSNKTRIINENAFQNCSSIENFNVNESNIEIISDYAFADMTTTYFNFGNNDKLQIIGEYAFKNCYFLNELSAKNIVFIKDNAFYACKGLTAMSVLGNDFIGKLFGKDTYGDSYLASYQNEDYYLPLSLKSINVSKTSTQIADYSFSGISSIKDFNFGNINIIGISALSGCELEEIFIPSTITKIKKRAFYDCTLLDEIVFENSYTLTCIEEYAFQNTKWENDIINEINNTNGCELIIIGNILYKSVGEFFEEVTIPDNITYISSKAFYNNSDIISVILPKNLVDTGNYVFENCNNIETIYVNGSVNIQKLFSEYQSDYCYEIIIDEDCFYIPYELKNIYIYDGTTKITDNAFADCKSITDIYIPCSVNEIGNGILSGCFGLETINIGGKFSLEELFGNTSYHNSYLAMQNGNCTYLPDSLSNITINGSSITPYAYQNATGIEIISISDTIVEIGKNAFENCNSIEDINLNQNIEYIGDFAFANTNIKEIEISGNAELGNAILSGCKNLITITINGNIPVYSLFGNSYFEGGYEADVINTKFYIPQTLTTINLRNSSTIKKYSLCNLSTVSTLTLPSELENIEKYAFYNLPLIFEMTLPSSLKIVGDYSFYNNKNNVIAFEDNSITYLGENAFKNCKKLQQFYSENILYIGKDAFSGCYSLSRISVPNVFNIGYIFGENIYENSYKIVQTKSYYIPTNLVSITVYGSGEMPQEMFSNINTLTEFNLIGEMKISNSVFVGCESLTTYVADK